MSRLREWSSRAAAFVRRGRSRDAEDLNDELQFHLSMTEEQLRRDGMSADAARREARVRVGGLTQVAEAYRDQRGLPIAETLLQDLRYAVRTLARTPGFTLAALVTLALGIGANTAIFSVVNTVLLRPLPYKDPGRLVMIGDRGADGSPVNVGYATFHDLRDRSRTLSEMAAVRSWNPTLAGGGEAERLSAMRVTWNYFAMLGVAPALGRGFTAAEDRPEQWHVVLLSDGLWRRRFGADPDVVGRTVSMNDVSYRIVGVMPASFEPLVSARFYQPAELWAPLGYDTSLQLRVSKLPALESLRPDRRGMRPRRRRGRSSTPSARSSPRPIRPTTRRARWPSRLCRTRLPARCGPCSTCSSAPSAWCCSSRARTSRTCSWPGPCTARARWRSAARSAPGARASSGRC